jgi:hypothetical protein
MEELKMSKFEYKVVNIISGYCLGVSTIVGGLYGFSFEIISLAVLSVAAIVVGAIVEKHNRKLD